jgi:hypothetical protein
MKQSIMITAESLTYVAVKLTQWFEQAIAKEKTLVLTLKNGELSVKPVTRNLDQNAKLWAMLTELSEQCIHFGQKYTPEDWKDILTASLKSELRMSPTIDGQRMVLLGMRTSKMTKAQMSELIELAYAHGTANGVRFSL